jgi:hypothetical protein
MYKQKLIEEKLPGGGPTLSENLNINEDYIKELVKSAYLASELPRIMKEAGGGDKIPNSVINLAGQIFTDAQFFKQFHKAQLGENFKI